MLILQILLIKLHKKSFLFPIEKREEHFLCNILIISVLAPEIDVTT